MFFKKRCPYCRFKFDKPPKRSRKCESCNERFFVQDGELITDRERMVRYFLNFANRFGGSKEMVEKTIDAKGPTATEGDIFWSIANSLLLKNKSRPITIESSSDIAMIYIHMADQLDNEGKDSSKLRDMSDDYLSRF